MMTFIDVVEPTCNPDGALAKSGTLLGALLQSPGNVNYPHGCNNPKVSADKHLPRLPKTAINAPQSKTWPARLRRVESVPGEHGRRQFINRQIIAQ
jgi:hypothetical protein